MTAMAFSAKIDHIRRQTHKKFRGRITVDDMTACMQNTIDERATSYAHLIDGRTAHSDCSAAEIEQLARKMRKIASVTPFGPIVMVADLPVTFGDFRSFASWVTDTCPIHVVHTLEEGEAYLRRASSAYHGSHGPQ